MTELRQERNVRIKQRVQEEIDNGLVLKQAFSVVGEEFYLSDKHVARIYYDTILEIEN